MRLICDICGGGLQINSGGQGAICAVCRLNYPMGRLREKLNLQMMSVPEVGPPMPEPPGLPVQLKPEQVEMPSVDEMKVETSGEPEVVPVPDIKAPVDKPTPPPKREIIASGTALPLVVPRQFNLRLEPGRGDVSGTVQQGGIGLGDQVYINYDYNHPYFVSGVNDGEVCAKEGMKVDLYLRDCPKSVLRNLFAVIGVPRPALNGHNYPGELEEYFLYVLEREFANCRIQIQAYKEGLTKPVDFVIYQEDKPILAVCLIRSGNRSDRNHAHKAEKLFRAEGVACTYFYRDYRNDMPYVIRRMREALKNRAN